MKKAHMIFCCSTAAVLGLAPILALPETSQTQSPGTTAPVTPPSQPKSATFQSSVIPKPNTLLDGTPIKLRLQRTISSADAHVGDSVDFDVLEEVKVGDTVVITKGAVALATVTTAEAKKRMGRGGKLDVNIDSVRLADNEKAALRATAGGKGGGHTGAMTGAMVATGIVFFPAAPLFLFMHGKDITIPKGTEVTAYIEGDFAFDPGKMRSQGADPSSVGTGASQNQVTIDASLPSCDIEVNGVFAGNTPSQLSLVPGVYKITVSKKGYKTWSKTMMVTGSGARLYAELEPEKADSTPSNSSEQN